MPVLPGSLELIGRFLLLLHHVVHTDLYAGGNNSHLVQSILTAIELSAQNITVQTVVYTECEFLNNFQDIGTTIGSIRLDVLVELLRVSENTQVANQALLLVASLARLAPDSAVHNVMPVFTFMGTNLLHRDDSFSFRIIQKVIILHNPMKKHSRVNRQSTVSFQ